jgi:hypothetical protein
LDVGLRIGVSFYSTRFLVSLCELIQSTSLQRCEVNEEEGKARICKNGMHLNQRELEISESLDTEVIADKNHKYSTVPNITRTVDEDKRKGMDPSWET